MKFLCVPCDKPMQLAETSSDGGSVSLVYSCPDCGYECAMLTNPMETQVVASLGVKVGAGVATEGSKCPFTGMVQGMDEAADEGSGAFPWTHEAEARMDGVPEFVRPMVRSGIERFAREQGFSEVDENVLDRAKSFFGM